MRTLLFLALSVSLIGCGDDDTRPGNDAGTDSGTVPLDGSPDIDGGGGDTDGGPGVDSGPVTSMCPAGECDLIANGCEAGQACYFASTEEGEPGRPVCIAAGTGATGTACERPWDCREGHDCANGRCVKFCCGGSTASCDTGDLCVGYSGLTHGTCRTPSGCSVLEQTGCDAGQACYPIGSDGTTDCFTPGDGMQGAACEALNACAGGFVCLASGICGRACDPAASDCGDGLMCATLGGGNGACVPMEG